MGTVDFLSPEQAMQSHTVDIRSDIYSLGCTFYYLLIGHAPFPEGTFLDKLIKHRMEEPPPLQTVRPDAPPAVAAVVRKMTAKKPQDRYQTPAEVVEALTAAVEHAAEAVAPAPLATPRPPAAESQQSTVDLTSQAITNETPSLVRRRRQATSRRWLLLGVVGGLVAVGGIVVLILWLQGAFAGATVENDKPDPPSPAKGPKKVDDAWIRLVGTVAAEKQVEVVAAKLKELNKGFDGKETHRIDVKGVVAHYQFDGGRVTDLTPLRALKGLRSLDCSGGGPGQGQLVDLAPLTGLPLTVLHISNTQVEDLTPLKEMKLTTLNCSLTAVSDLTPLSGMKLRELYCDATEVRDLSPLSKMPLTVLRCDFKPERDGALLRKIKTLQRINGKPANQFWEDLDAKKP
jgi:hypothetical protein